MNPLPQRRLSGATLLLGGLLTAIGFVLMPTTSTDPLITPASWLVFGGNVLLLISLPSFHAVQARAAGALGWWAMLAVCLGLGASQLPFSVLGLADPHYLDDDSVFHSSAAGTAEFVGLLVLAVGVVLLAVATFRARVHPRWAAWCLVAIVVISLVVQFLPDISTAVRYPMELFVLVGALGVAVMRAPAPESAQSEPFPVPVA
jgi:hypothetical protein